MSNYCKELEDELVTEILEDWYGNTSEKGFLKAMSREAVREIAGEAIKKFGINGIQQYRQIRRFINHG